MGGRGAVIQQRITTLTFSRVIGRAPVTDADGNTVTRKVRVAVTTPTGRPVYGEDGKRVYKDAQEPEMKNVYAPLTGAPTSVQLTAAVTSAGFSSVGAARAAFVKFYKTGVADKKTKRALDRLPGGVRGQFLDGMNQKSAAGVGKGAAAHIDKEAKRAGKAAMARAKANAKAFSARPNAKEAPTLTHGVAAVLGIKIPTVDQLYKGTKIGAAAAATTGAATKFTASELFKGAFGTTTALGGGQVYVQLRPKRSEFVPPKLDAAQRKLLTPKARLAYEKKRTKGMARYAKAVQKAKDTAKGMIAAIRTSVVNNADFTSMAKFIADQQANSRRAQKQATKAHRDLKREAERYASQGFGPRAIAALLVQPRNKKGVRRKLKKGEVLNIDGILPTVTRWLKASKSKSTTARASATKVKSFADLQKAVTQHNNKLRKTATKSGKKAKRMPKVPTLPDAKTMTLTQRVELPNGNWMIRTFNPNDRNTLPISMRHSNLKTQRYDS
jgi:hypothetical protein